MTDVAVLAADSLEGRAVGSVGGGKARAYIQAAFSKKGLQMLGDTYEQPFEVAVGSGSQVTGVNMVGVLPGTVDSDAYIVITAHYDHLGIRRGQIYNGADDNASGVAGLLALAGYFNQHPPRHSLLFVAFDGEEVGLQGAFAFLKNPPIPLDRMALNINLDMISRNEHRELFIAGTSHYPALKPVLQDVAARSTINVRFGHDGADTRQDWSTASDHGVFHNMGIPFVYFGVEDHPDYHQPTDDVDNIDPVFFAQSVATILDAVLTLDKNLDTLLLK